MTAERIRRIECFKQSRWTGPAAPPRRADHYRGASGIGDAHTLPRAFISNALSSRDLNLRAPYFSDVPLALAARQGFPSTAWQLSRIWLGLRGAFPNQLMQDSIQWVLRICAIEPLITIAATNDQIRRLKL